MTPDHEATALHASEALVTFLHDAYIAILSRYPDAVGEAHFLHKLRSGAMSRTDVLRALSESDEAKGRGRGLYARPAFGQTRDCHEPWYNFVLKANGDVYPCCSHAPIGRVNPGVTLAQVLDGPNARALRQGILSGRLDAWCMSCKSQSVIDADEFRRKVVRRDFLAGRDLDGSGWLDLDRHPELGEVFAFSESEHCRSGLADRICFVAEPQATAADVLIRHHDPGQACDLVVTLEQRAPGAGRTLVRIELLSSRRTAVETLLSGSMRSALTLTWPHDDGPVSIRYAFKIIDRGSSGPTELYFSYPFFDVQEPAQAGAASTRQVQDRDGAGGLRSGTTSVVKFVRPRPQERSAT